MSLFIKGNFLGNGCKKKKIDEQKEKDRLLNEKSSEMIVDAIKYEDQDEKGTV